MSRGEESDSAVRRADNAGRARLRVAPFSGTSGVIDGGSQAGRLAPRGKPVTASGAHRCRGTSLLARDPRCPRASALGPTSRGQGRVARRVPAASGLQGSRQGVRGVSLRLRQTPAGQACRPALAAIGALLLLCGCRTSDPVRRYSAAQQMFDRTVRECHLPAAQAQGAEKQRLLSLAADGYESLLRQYRDQPRWCAQALRSLGNVRAEEGRIDEAVGLYSRVARQYPAQDWEILQAWKSAADLLWDADRQGEARPFYQKIVHRFDVPESPPIMKTAVRGAKARLP
jgi:hypothetical protein